MRRVERHKPLFFLRSWGIKNLIFDELITTYASSDSKTKLCDNVSSIKSLKIKIINKMVDIP